MSFIRSLFSSGGDRRSCLTPVIILLALHALGPSARAQAPPPTGSVTFTFQDLGGGQVQVTGSGMTGPWTGPSTGLFAGFNYATPNLWTGPSGVQAVIPGTMPLVQTTSMMSFPVNNIVFGTGNLSILSTPPFDVLTGANFASSGASTFSLPPGSTFANFGLPSFTTAIGALNGFSFQLVFIPLPPQANGQNPPPRRQTPVERFLATDIGAINSARTSGLQIARMTRHLSRLGIETALGDINEHRFRVSTGQTTGLGENGFGDLSDSADRPGVFNSDGTDPGILRYLQFAGHQMIDYRVALGLAEGEEVELIDTLAIGDSGWTGHPVAMMGGPVMIPVSMKAVVAVPEGSGKNVVDSGKVVIEDDPLHRFGVYSAFDYGFYDQDRLTRSARGFDVDSYAGSIGLEHRLFPWLMVGGAFSHLWADAEADAGLGSVDLDGQMYTAYATATFGGTWLDLLYSYGSFENEINRNTGLGPTARGDTDSDSHTISFNAGHIIPVTDQIYAGPLVGLDYSNGDIDGYTERGGGSANLIYPDDNFESMVGRLGGQVTFKNRSPLGKMTTQVRAGWAHEFMPDSDSVSASLQTSPFTLVSGGSARRIGGFTATDDGAHPGTDWLELGAGVRLDLGDSPFHLQFDYEGQFGRNNASAHFGSAKIGCEW